MLPSVAPTRRLRRALAATTAVLLAASTGAALAHGDRPTRGGHHRGITGTVSGIDAPDFTLTRRDGATVAVTTTDETRFAKTVDATVADATPGTFVSASGRPTEDGALAADRLAIRPAPSREDAATPAAAAAKGRAGGRGGEKDGRVRGTVVSNDPDTGTLVVRTRAGRDRAVTTSPDTRVTRTYETGFAELAVGDRVRVFGSRNADGGITARGVHIQAATPAEPSRESSARQTSNSAPSRDNAPPSTVAATTSPRGVVPPVSVPDLLQPGRPPRGERGGVAGTVKSVEEPNFVVAHDGGTTTVSTSEATELRKTVDAALDDAGVGKGVAVAGQRNDDGSITAFFVHIHPEAPGRPQKNGCDRGRCFLTGVVTANDAAARTFTVSVGEREVLVRATDSTRFAETLVAAFSDLAPGQRVMAKGTRAADGTLAADGVHIDLTTHRAKDPSVYRESTADGKERSRR